MTRARAIFDKEILPLFEQSVPGKVWLARARIEARYLARKFGSVTIDMVRENCPPPEGLDPRIMGAVFLRNSFEKIGYINSDRETCHGRPVAQFKLREGVLV